MFKEFQESVIDMGTGVDGSSTARPMELRGDAVLERKIAISFVCERALASHIDIFEMLVEVHQQIQDADGAQALAKWSMAKSREATRTTDLV